MNTKMIDVSKLRRILNEAEGKGDAGAWEVVSKLDVLVNHRRELTNSDRAGHGAGALISYADETGLAWPADQREALVDLLADLMHWADQYDESFAAGLLAARTNFEEEKAEEAR